MRRTVLCAALCTLGVVLMSPGCSPNRKPTSGTTETPVRIRLATSTSTENSGLLEALLPSFEQAHDVRVDVIAVGTGKALKLAERGDVDAVLVHAPEAEQEFVEAGFGVDRRAVMHNDFVILGPPGDPVGVARAETAVSALQRIAQAEARFVSRGDDSGTHHKEQALWRQAGFQPRDPWYMETGQGMGATLFIADEKRAYVVCDRATYLALKDKLFLVVLYEGDRELLNPYHVIAVNPARHPHLRHQQVLTFIDWLTSPEGQTIIGNFRKEGEALFHPGAEVESASGAWHASEASR